MTLNFDQRLERIVELCDAKKEIEREIRELLGETQSDDTQEKTKRRVVRYERSMEEYVMQLLTPGVILHRDEIFRQIRNVAGATVLRPTVNNAISSLKRKGMIERSIDGESYSITSVPTEPHQATLSPPADPLPPPPTI